MLKKLKYIIKKHKLRNRMNTFGPFTKGIIYDTENGLIAMPYEDMIIGKHLGFKGSWNLPEIELLRQKIHSHDTVYIIGTHVGTLLIPLAQDCKKIVGYEANPNTYGFLEKNILLNNLKNTQTYNYAVGDKNKKISFYKSKINTGGSKIKPAIDDFRYKFDNPEEIEVQMISLDDHIAKNKLPLPDCLLMDIEGAEFLALQGMQETLKNIRFLYIEYVPHHLKNVSEVTNTQFIGLIEPFFDLVISIKTNVEIDISSSSLQLLEFLDKLYGSERSDDLLFMKRNRMAK